VEALKDSKSRGERTTHSFASIAAAKERIRSGPVLVRGCSHVRVKEMPYMAALRGWSLRRVAVELYPRSLHPMESNIDHLFHSAYPIPPQHQPFPDSHPVVQDQFHRTSHSLPHPSWPHTHNDDQAAPHLYNFYNRPPPSSNDQPPSPPHSDPQPSFPQDPTPPPHALQSSPPIDDEPLYVNAKQYYRILKRRVARARLEEVHRLSQKRKVTSLSTPYSLFASLISYKLF
jgi:hypothetical protein